MDFLKELGSEQYEVKSAGLCHGLNPRAKAHAGSWSGYTNVIFSKTHWTLS